MTNPPTVRQWTQFDFNPTPPKPSPQTQPSQQPSAPSSSGAAGTISAPSSPAQNVLPNPPSLKASQAPDTSTVDNDAHTNAPKSPQRTTPAVETTVPSQNPKLSTPPPPPSPLALPPSRVKGSTRVDEPKKAVEPEPKATPVGKESGENKKQGIGNHEAEENEAKEKGIHKKLLIPEESGISAIIISGKFEGAVMEIVQSERENNNIQKNVNSNSEAHYTESQISGSGEGNANRKNQNHKERPVTSEYINSNVQFANGSVLYGSSCTSTDPGVHGLTLSRKPSGEGFHQREHVHGKNNGFEDGV